MVGHAPERSLVYEREDFTESGRFHVTPEEAGMRVPGPGSLDTLLVACGSDNFGVRVETKTTTLLDDDYTRLERFSSDLAHVSAYQNTSGGYVISVSDFPYLQHVRAAVTVRGEADFDWVRAVYTIEE